MSFPPLPEPPEDAVTLPTVHETCVWYRVHACEHDAVYFNLTATYRFNLGTLLNEVGAELL